MGSQTGKGFRVGEPGAALVGGEVTEVAEVPAEEGAALGWELPPGAEDAAGLPALLGGQLLKLLRAAAEALALGGRHRFQAAHAVEHQALALGREVVEPAEALAQALLLGVREVLEAGVSFQCAQALAGRQVGEPLEETHHGPDARAALVRCAWAAPLALRPRARTGAGLALHR